MGCTESVLDPSPNSATVAAFRVRSSALFLCPPCQIPMPLIFLPTIREDGRRDGYRATLMLRNRVVFEPYQQPVRRNATPIAGRILPIVAWFIRALPGFPFVWRAWDSSSGHFILSENLGRLANGPEIGDAVASAIPNATVAQSLRARATHPASCGRIAGRSLPTLGSSCRWGTSGMAYDLAGEDAPFNPPSRTIEAGESRTYLFWRRFYLPYSLPCGRLPALTISPPHPFHASAATSTQAPDCAAFSQGARLIVGQRAPVG